MYLVVVAVRTPDWCVNTEHLRLTLRRSTASSDRLEHVYLEAYDGQAVLSLYLQAADQSAAVRMAEQLSRRTMATVSQTRRWQVESIRTL